MSFIDDIKRHVEGYYQWLKENTEVKDIDSEWVEITTPYLDRHNDCLQIYTKRESDGYLLTDDGYILDDLLSSGCSLKTGRRKELLKITLAGFGVYADGESLNIKATSENFSEKKHNLLQAMLAVNDLFYLAPSQAATLFLEDVTRWMDSENIRYVPHMKLSGKSGYDHMFDFVVPKSKQYPERIIQTMNSPDRNKALLVLSKWIDTRETRPPNSELFVLINDSADKIPNGVQEALSNYQLKSIPWSERDERLECLSY